MAAEVVDEVVSGEQIDSGPSEFFIVIRVNKLEGFDPKGLDICFRRQAFEMILSKLNDLAKKSNYLSSHEISLQLQPFLQVMQLKCGFYIQIQIFRVRYRSNEDFF